MNYVLRDLYSPALVQAIEENAEEFLITLGRAAGAEERDDGRVRWVIGDIPIDYHNCVVRANLTLKEVDGVIMESLERFRGPRSVPLVCPRRGGRGTVA